MKQNTFPFEFLFDKKSVAARVFAALAFAALLLLTGLRYFHYSPFDKAPDVVTSTTTSCPPPAVVKYNMTEYKYARPMLVIDVLNQGDLNDNPLSGLESGILAMIENDKQTAGLINASVYIQQLNTGNFITINGDQRFHPASLSKVPVMMVYLRESELRSGLLSNKIYFSGSQHPRMQNFPPDQAMKAGTYYTVKELIERSIVKSDNDADLLLTAGMNMYMWTKLFADLELPVPDMTNMNYTLNATEYSRFMRVLYNATYLSNEHADYALSLLVQAQFKEGMQKQIPADVTIANKFGEYGTNDAEGNNTDRELHESAIIYIPGNPMLVTVMTKGKDTKQLTRVVSDIGKYVYDQMKNKGS